MTDINSPSSKNAGTPSDLVSLADIGGDATPAPAGAQDSILNAAHEFEVQLEQMSAWKHQLAQQMEVMRRDGIKLLERQKSLALEKKKIGEERDTLTKERQHLETLHRELTEGTKALRAKEEELAGARGELQKLQTERSRWEEEMRGAQSAAQQLESRKSEINGAIAAAEARLQEVQGLLGQRDDLQNQVNAAREALGGIEQQRAAAEGKLHELSVAQAELQAKEKALAEQEARRLEQDVQLRSSLEQHEQQRRELADAQRVLLHERENLGQQNTERTAQLEARERELAAREQSAAQALTELSAREEQLAAVKRTHEQQQAQITGQQEQILLQQRELMQKKMGIDEELQGRLDAAEKAKKQMEEERTTLLKQRRDLEKKLDEMEQELSGQLEALAKQTKRLTERRADLDQRTEELEKEYTQRLERETNTLRDELAAKERAYEKRIALVQQQLEQTQAGASDVQGREAALRSQLDAAAEKISAGQKELSRLAAELEEVNRDRTAQGNLLKEQVRRYEQDLTEWQRKLDAATAQGSQAAGAASTEVSTTKQALAEARGELEQTRSRLAEAEAQKRAWEEKAGAPAENPAQVAELKAQIEMLEKQRIDLAGQIFTVQDAMRRHSEDAMLAKNVMESELIELRRRHAALEAERKSWQSTPRSTQPAVQGGVSAEEAERAQQALAAHREKLLQQARTLRAHKRQSRESAVTLDQNRQDIAQQREQLRSRKENLEQVKRLLEKQEMVMARKLADHNALKTVAAVGIFVIMVLGSTFIGVYKFANPTYRSEAVIQLAPGQGVAGSDLQAWMARQMEFMRSEDVTFAAWKVLRSPENHYAMQDGRDEWLTSLSKNLVMQIDPTTKTLTVRYAGPIAEGVSQVCNALATAYTNPGMRDTGKPENKQMGAGASLVAQATIPAFAAEDNRMTLSLCVVAVVLFVSLLLVIVFRHYVARQLREIDQMADEQDLEDIQAEMPADVNPA